MNRAWVLVALLGLAGCAHHRIPGTDIEANSDTTAIVGVMQKYHAALESKDVPAIVSLLGPDFYDNGGTGDPSDDLTLKNVQPVLTERFSRVQDLALDMELRNIEIHGPSAIATYFYTEHYKLPTLTSRPQTESDLKQMTLEKVKGVWKIQSGI